MIRLIQALAVGVKLFHDFTDKQDLDTNKIEIQLLISKHMHNAHLEMLRQSL